MPESIKKWTIMVYLAGDNDLDEFGVTDLNEMKSVGSNSDINVLAQFDRSGATTQTRRYYLRSGTPLDEDRVSELGETNMGDPKILQDFLAWGMQNYPAEHYLAILWNHGAGWSDEDVYRRARDAGYRIARRGVSVRSSAVNSRPVPNSQVRALARRLSMRKPLFSVAVEEGIRKRGIAFDDEAQDFLDNVEVKKVLTQVKKSLGRKLDILGMDACLMNMVEVAYQVRDCVSFSVGSEEVEPGDGWPYDRILRRLAANPAMAPRDFSKVIVDEYLRSYGATENVTQSVLDLGRAEVLRVAIDRLATALRSALSKTAYLAPLLLARRKTQHYYVPEYVDLADLCINLKAARIGPKTGAVTVACDGVFAAIAGCVVAAGAKGTDVRDSHGISIYWPEDEISATYAKLDFTKKSKWDQFLAAYIRVTRH